HDDVPLHQILRPPAATLFPYTTLFRSVAKHLGISMGNHHRAVDDAMTTVSILLKSIEKMKDMGIHSLKELNARSRENADVSRLRSEEHTSELQSRENLVCRLLLEKKKN